MPGSLLEGYMAGKRYLQEREEKEEEGKREKLNDQIRELEFKRLTRGLERSAEEWEQRKTQYGQAQADRERGIGRSDVEWGQEQADRERQQAALERVRAGSRDPVDLHEAGIKIEKKPTIRSMTDAERAEAYSKIPENQQTEYQKKFLKKYFEGTRGATKPISPTGIPGLDEDVMESGATFDPASGAFIHVPEDMAGPSLPGQGTGLENLDLGAIGQPPAGTVTEGGQDEQSLIEYIDAQGADRAEAEAFLKQMGYTDQADITRILGQTKFK